MTERRYSEEEAAAIFARAAEAEAEEEAERGAGPSAIRRAEGRTLAQLQAIGAEAGLPPELVARAARTLDRGGEALTWPFFGFPLAVGRTVELDRHLSDDDWARLVSDLRTTFNAAGRARTDGPFRQWANGNLKAMVEPTETGDRLRLRTMKGDARGMMQGGLALFGISIVLLFVFLIGAEPAADWGPMVLLALLGGGLFAGGALQLPGWAARRLDQMEEVAARVVAATASDPDAADPGDPGDPAGPPALEPDTR